ncbi:DNA recombination protein RmuC [Halomonas sp. H5]|uniref:DNA recombination protein RmuC n=1 Tax=Halomonas sp. H5 TaxID=3423910 RepID=UPI003D35FD97
MISDPLLSSLLAGLFGALLASGLVGAVAARRLGMAREAQARLAAERDAAREALAAARETQQGLETRLARAQQGEQELRQERERLTEHLALKEQHFQEQLALLKESRSQLTQEFEALANEVLERKGRAFGELSQQRIQGLLQPLHSEMKGFRDQVASIQRQESEQRIQLRTELQQLQSLNREITDQAQRLTQALQGQKKVQGNWGELMLENVLDGSGLRLGKDYRREVSIATEAGRRRPDAIVYLPQRRHLVIDAKTSLVAYVRYVNAETDAERREALGEHCQAMAARIDELAERHYYDLPGLNSPEVVVMFVPVESAYVEALKADETLFQRALEKNVLVATPTTLLTSLNIVRQLWRFEDQSRHSAELAGRAERFHAKLRTFLVSMEEVGRKLDGARGSYDQALGQLVNGKGNLVKQAADFAELGVAVKRELPESLVERARLELETPRGEAGASPEASEAGPLRWDS